MVLVDFPTCPSSSVNANATIRTYKFWTTLKNFFTQRCYRYPVVYTDGLISYVVSDGKNRTPWGIAIGEYIIALDAPTEEMTIQEARDYCKNIVFAGRKATLPSIETMRYLVRESAKFNKMLKTLGGSPLQFSDYLSSTTEKDGQFSLMSINFSEGRCTMQTHYSTDNKVCIRPAINLCGL